nr:MAG TPA: TraY domain [Caudoviricetes sp.]
MKVRFGEKLLSEMRRAELHHGVSYSEIARKALRKTRRLKIRIKRKKAETTYGGEAIRIDVEESEFPGVTPAEIRSAIAWYLSRQPETPAPRPVDDGGLIAGVDYKIASII